MLTPRPLSLFAIRAAGSAADVEAYKLVLDSACGFKSGLVSYKDASTVLPDSSCISSSSSGLGTSDEDHHAVDSSSSTGGVSLPRFLVKIKKELISMGNADANPSTHPSPATHLSPEELNSWFDSNKPFVMLDTRNDYEVRLGTFAGAKEFNITTFREFPKSVVDNLSSLLPPSDDAAAREVERKEGPLPPQLPGAAASSSSIARVGVPIVMFCTGGIRCEKAAFAVVDAGVPASDLYQLDGGILNYLMRSGEKDRKERWQGSCFVFDDRVAVDSDMKPVEGMRVCFRCRDPRTKEDINERLAQCGAGATTFVCDKCGHDDFLNAKLAKRKRNS